LRLLLRFTHLPWHLWVPFGHLHFPLWQTRPGLQHFFLQGVWPFAHLVGPANATPGADSRPAPSTAPARLRIHRRDCGSMVQPLPATDSPSIDGTSRSSSTSGTASVTSSRIASGPGAG